jgi:hypothetical protein
MRAKLLFSSLVFSLSCNSSTPPSPPTKTTTPTSQHITPVDARSLTDFGAEWVEVASLSDESQKRLRALSLPERWEGRQYEWDGFIMSNLCDETLRRCAANVIDRKKFSRPELLGGFFASLFFTEGGFAALRQLCKGRAGCVVRFRGVLSSLRTDPEMPLGMDFTEVTALTSRGPAPTETWWRQGSSLQIPKEYQPSSISLANPNEPPLPPLKVKLIEKTF